MIRVCTEYIDRKIVHRRQLILGMVSNQVRLNGSTGAASSTSECHAHIKDTMRNEQ